MRKGNETRERILDIAEAAVLAKGFGATSIDEIIAEAGITKSGFFYHFKDKNELARGLLSRYGQRLDQLLADIFGRAGELSDDPLQRLLIGLTLFAEHMAAMPGGHPGCLVATMSYQDRLFDREVRGMVTGDRARVERPLPRAWSTTSSPSTRRASRSTPSRLARSHRLRDRRRHHHEQGAGRTRRAARADADGAQLREDAVPVRRGSGGAARGRRRLIRASGGGRTPPPAAGTT